MALEQQMLAEQAAKFDAAARAGGVSMARGPQARAAMIPEFINLLQQSTMNSRGIASDANIKQLMDNVNSLRANGFNVQDVEKLLQQNQPRILETPVWQNVKDRWPTRMGG